MSDFHIRVELHRANGEDYTKLHQLMQTAGFSRTVTGSRKVELPTGTYWYSGSSNDGAAICARVEEIAKTVKPSNPAPYVFVSGDGGTGHTWWSRNLPTAH